MLNTTIPSSYGWEAVKRWRVLSSISTTSNGSRMTNRSVTPTRLNFGIFLCLSTKVINGLDFPFSDWVWSFSSFRRIIFMSSEKWSWRRRIYVWNCCVQSTFRHQRRFEWHHEYSDGGRRIYSRMRSRRNSISRGIKWLARIVSFIFYIWEYFLWSFS